MGLVYRGRDLRGRCAVVIKLLPASDDEQGEKRARFLQEARTAEKIHHPNAVTLLDHGQCHDEPYLVMEALDGQTLEQALSERGTLTPEHTLAWLLPVMGALSHMHDRGVIHRDLKPSNIFLHRDGSGATVPKLLDFGLARSESSSSLTRSGMVVGTPHYMAPEQASDGPVSSASDVWSMAAVIHRCLAGAPPFSSESVAALLARVAEGRAPRLRQRAPEVPAKLAAVVDRGLSSLTDRYRDMRQLARALALSAAADGVALPADPDPIGLPHFPEWLCGDGDAPPTESGLLPAAAAPGHALPLSLVAVLGALLTLWLLPWQPLAIEARPAAPPAVQAAAPPATAPRALAGEGAAGAVAAAGVDAGAGEPAPLQPASAPAPADPDQEVVNAPSPAPRVRSRRRRLTRSQILTPAPAAATVAPVLAGPEPEAPPAVERQDAAPAVGTGLPALRRQW